jgi:ferredoxin-type protein NapG
MGEKMTRRHLLEAIACAAVVSAASVVVMRFRKAEKHLLRPPGAQPRGDFEAACIRCFRCAEVCPPQCIVFLSDLPPQVADTPFIDPNTTGCIMCMQCQPACPTGALVTITRAQIKMGTPALSERDCFAHNGKRACRVCFDVCPLQNQAVALNGKLAPAFFADACTGCGLCQAACPAENADGARAIRILPLDVA